MGKPLTRTRLIKDIEAFCVRQKISTTDFGLKALGDGSFFGRLKKTERSPTLERIERAYDYMILLDGGEFDDEDTDALCQ